MCWWNIGIHPHGSVYLYTSDSLIRYYEIQTIFSLAHPPLAEPSPFPLLYSYLIFPILCSLSCVCGPTTHIVSPFPLSFLSYCRYLSLSHTHTHTHMHKQSLPSSSLYSISFLYPDPSPPHTSFLFKFLPLDSMTYQRVTQTSQEKKFARMKMSPSVGSTSTTNKSLRKPIQIPSVGTFDFYFQYDRLHIIL